MSKRDKLLKRVLELDTGLRFIEIKELLESYGYEARFPSGGSSHCTFRKKGRGIITVPAKQPINKVYLKLLRRIVIEEEAKLL